MRGLGVMVVVAGLALGSCNDEGDGDVSLLSDEHLDGEWRETPSVGEPLPICGVDVPSLQGESSSRRIQYLSEPDSEEAVTHEVVEYRSRDDAVAAMSAFESASTACSEFTRADGDGEADVEVEVEKMTVPGHAEAVAIRLLITWADGSGQGYIATAEQKGDSVSYLTLDAPQGGRSSVDAVAELLDAVQAGN